MSALIIYLCLAVFVSFLCSLLEATILSITPTKIGVLKRRGSKAATLLENYKDNINKPLSSILTINTAANMIGAAGVGAEVSRIYGDTYLALASTALTVIILIFSEIIPKTLGARFSEKIAPSGAYIIQFLIWISYPIVMISEKITDSIPEEEEENTRAKEEMIVTAEMNQTQGKINEKESVILKNLLNLDSENVSNIMTPRSVVSGYQKDVSVAELLKSDKTIRYSRLPVYGEDLDDIVGVVHRYKLIEAERLSKAHESVSEFCSDIYYIPQSASVANALDQFIKTKQHLFVVIDAYGSTAGIVTLEDAIESLLGEDIIDEYDEEDIDQRIEVVTTDKKKFIIKRKT